MNELIIILIVLVGVMIGALIYQASSSRREMERLRQALRDEETRGRQEAAQNLERFGQSVFSRMNESSGAVKGQMDTFINQLNSLTRMNEQKLETVRDVVEKNLRLMQDDNSRQLEKMRETVDEKLHSTLEKRLGESFHLVSERLELVHKGLGEMQTLASGVGDLKRVLTNVKTRGTWGEFQLSQILEQIFTREQYDVNVETRKGSRERVEFAIKMPGKDEPVYLPIDAKFPVEDYQRLQNAQEQGDPALIEEARKALESCLKQEAKKIRDKYLDPPHTTDFAVLYVPTEGLYAEILQRPGLNESLQLQFRVIVAGPMTIAALLNSLQMGFRTLTVEKRASEVWRLLGQVKTEFGKFGDLLDKTRDKLTQAGKNIDLAARKSRTIERRLKDVQELPSVEQDELLPTLEEDNDDRS